MVNCDCSGWATKNDLLCGDGRVIKKNAFINQDGQQVPLVWNHDHQNQEAVIGHAILENRDSGVYAYCTFNNTEKGKHAKELVEHGDVRSLSIWANHLKQIGNEVVHGVIRELSLVLGGANPGAYVDFVMAHGDDELDGVEVNYDECILVLCHSDEPKEEKGDTTVATTETKPEEKNIDEKTIAEVFDTLTEEQKQVVYALIGNALEEKGDSEEEPVKHADEEVEDDEETIEDVFNTLNDKQKQVVYALLGQALEENDTENEGGKTDMKHNIFDQETQESDVLSHSEFAEIVGDAKRAGSLKEAFLEHGITNIDYLFPEAQTIDNVPGFIKRDDTWVSEVMNGFHKTPFSRIKSVHADITEADARAKGYVKGAKKADEVFSLLKRVTTPTTVYKKQKLDRDDVVDITDFDVIAFLKSEMRMMLDEEIARAALVGDGRSASSADKINEGNIRPIWTDDDVYTIKAEVAVTSTTTDDEKAKGFIRATIKSRKDYKGSGNPFMFMPEEVLTNCLLLEDKNGRVIYDTIEKLATALRVKKIVPVPVMENLTRVVGANTHTLAGIYVNLNDYNLGADKGGAVNMFDDFDIDYNAMKYLIETRCSGALTVPYSAVAVEFVAPTKEQD